MENRMNKKEPTAHACYVNSSRTLRERAELVPYGPSRPLQHYILAVAQESFIEYTPGVLVEPGEGVDPEWYQLVESSSVPGFVGQVLKPFPPPGDRVEGDPETLVQQFTSL